MSSVKELLDEHNKLAKRSGGMQLSTWKQDKSKLQARIDSLKKALPIDKKLPTKKLPKEEAEDLIEKEAKRKEDNDNFITIVQIAEENKVNPKVLRAKLRRNGKHSNEGRWSRIRRDSKEHKEIIALAVNKKDKTND